MNDQDAEIIEYERKWLIENGAVAEPDGPNERQMRCARLVRQWVGGFHHAPRTVRVHPRGVTLVISRSKSLSTFDGYDLTKLVLLAHDHCVRAEITTAGMHLEVQLHARVKRDGSIMERHPTIDEAIRDHRKNYVAQWGVGHDSKPLGRSRELPSTGWINNPTPGLYWTRSINADGTRTQPVFCLVTPGGPDDRYEPWAYTPSLPHEHPSWTNYFAHGGNHTEYLPYTEDLTGTELEFELKWKEKVDGSKN